MKRFTGDPVFPIKSLNPGPNLASWSADECGEQSVAFDPAELELHAVGELEARSGARLAARCVDSAG